MRLPAPHGQLATSIYIPSMLMAISNQGMLLVLPLYALNISGSPAYAALVVALRGVGVLLLDIPAGVLAARFGDKNVLIGGLICNAAVMLGLAVWTDPWAVAVLATLQGGAAAAWFLGRHSYLTDATPVSMWGRAIAVVAGINRGGAFLGPLAGGIVAEWLGYGAAFLAGGMLSMLAVAVSGTFARKLRPDKEPDTAGLAVIAHIVAEHAKVFSTAGLVGLAIQLMRAGRQLLVPLFGTVIGLDAATIGFVYSLSAILDMSLFYPAGIVLDRFGRRWTGIPCMVVFVAGLILLPLADGFAGLVTAALVLGFANGISTGIVMVMGMDLAPTDNRSHFLGVWRLIGDVGSVGGPLVTGALASAASLATASFAVAGLGVLGLIAFVLLVPETKRIRGATGSGE